MFKYQIEYSKLVYET